MQSSTRRSHDTLIDRGGINVDKFTTPAVNDGLNVFVTTADEPQTETVEAAEASPATSGAGVTLQSEKATFATILSFVEGSVLGTTETVEQNQDSNAHDTCTEQGTGQNRQALFKYQQVDDGLNCPQSIILSCLLPC